MKGLQLSSWNMIITVKLTTIELLLFIYFQGSKLIVVNFMTEIYEENINSLVQE